MLGTPKIQQLLDDAVTHDVPYMAHLIYFLTLTKKVELTSPASLIQDIHLQPDEYNQFLQMYQSDVLKMRRVKLFAVQVNIREFAFYFSENPAEVQVEHQKIYGNLPKKMSNAYNQMIDRSFYFPESKQYKSFRDLLAETVEFPKYVCTLEAAI